MLDAEGRVVSTVTFNLPGTAKLAVFDLDRGPDGAIAFAATALDDAGRQSCLIARLNADGSNLTFLRTLPYRPKSVAFAPDGTLRVAGSTTSWTNTTRFR